MRKRLFRLLLVLLTLCLSAPALADTATVNLTINGKPATPPAPPFIQNGCTMVPLRFIIEQCGMLVDWDANLRRVTVIGETNALRLDIGSDIAYVNGEPVQLQVPAMISGGHTMVPLRFVMENSGALVEWEAATRTVALTLTISPVRDIIAETPAGPVEPLVAVPTPTPQPAPAKNGHISGYYFDTSSWEMLSARYSDFDTVIHFSYKVFADGSIAAKNYTSGWTANAEPLLTQLGTEKLLLVTDFGDPLNGGEESADKMLADTAARAAAVANIANLVLQSGAAGVDIDFEKITIASKDNFTAFIRELKAALGSKLVTVSLPPKRSDNETWLDKFDYLMLGQAADRLHIMFYDQHYANSDPGPVATPAWIRQGLDYLTKLVPREKLHVMLGVYGRAWGGNVTGTTVNLTRALEIIDEFGATQNRDEASGVPYLTYKDKDGNDIVLWYEDAQSLGQKAAIAREYGVGGLGVWRMGRVPDDVWQSILANFYK